MKKISLFFIIILVTFPLFAVDLTGFWGIPFGTSKEQVKMIMSQKGYDTNLNATDGLIFRNVSFSGRTCEMGLIFYQNKFYMAAMTFLPSTNNTYDFYADLKYDLIKKYSYPQIDQENYKYPYAKADGQTETAISLNFTNIGSAWIFDNSNEISLLIKHNDKEYQNEVLLYYFETKTFDSYQNQQNSSNLDDL